MPLEPIPIQPEPSGFELRLEVFSGPLDLLLRLIEARELDVLTVPLAEMADAYVAHLSEHPVPADELADFVAIASQLILLKSRRLLPGEPAPVAASADEEPDEEELRRRLLEYRAIRDAARELGAWEGERASYRREPRESDLPEAPTEPMPPTMLAEALERLAAIPEPMAPPPDVVPREVTIAMQIAALRRAMGSAGPRSASRCWPCWSWSAAARRPSSSQSSSARSWCVFEPGGGFMSAADDLGSFYEALLFIAERPLTTGELAELGEVPLLQAEGALADLAERLEEDERGLRLQRMNEEWQLVTAPELGARLAAYAARQEGRLSPAALEALAVIAYRQPCTRGDVDRVRGVDSDYVIRSLLHRRLITEVGRRDTPGRPILLGTTFTFLERFGLSSLDDLPVLSSEAAALTALPPEVISDALPEPSPEPADAG
jgi:segregation and condensation protein B